MSVGRVSRPGLFLRMPDKSGEMTLTIAMLASVLGSLAAAAYAVAGAEPSPIVALFLSLGPLLAVILWLQGDAARTGVGSVLDLGYFLLLAWPFVIPVRVQNAGTLQTGD